jgi:hypothetical protein
MNAAILSLKEVTFWSLLLERRDFDARGSTCARLVRLDQAQAGEIGDRPPLIVDGDRFGVVHSEQDLGGGIDAHVMDKGADCVITCLDAQK